MSDENDIPPHEELLATIADFVLVGRHDRVEKAYLGTQAPEVSGTVGYARDTLAAIAAAVQPEAPPAALRARLMSTLTRTHARKKRSALLVVDMIRDHLDPGKPLEVPRARDIVPALTKRLEEARAAGIPVIYVVDQHEPDDSDLDAWGQHAVKGSEGVEVWPALTPKPGDLVVNKPSFSAFFQSNLDKVLDDLKIDSLVLTGCLTEVGLMATATDAMQRGFEVEVPVDSQAGGTADNEKGALCAMGLMTAYGPSRKKLLDHLAQSAA